MEGWSEKKKTLSWSKNKGGGGEPPLDPPASGQFLMSPAGEGTASLHSHPSQAKVQLFAGQRQYMYLHFSVILDPEYWCGPGN